MFTHVFHVDVQAGPQDAKSVTTRRVMPWMTVRGTSSVEKPDTLPFQQHAQVTRPAELNRRCGSVVRLTENQRVKSHVSSLAVKYQTC